MIEGRRRHLLRTSMKKKKIDLDFELFNMPTLLDTHTRKDPLMFDSD